MEIYNFNQNWEFALENQLDAYNRYGLYEVQRGLGAPEWHYHFNNWKKIDLPHDWAVGLPKDMRANTYSASRPTSHYNRFTTEYSVLMDEKEICSVGWYRKEFPYRETWKGKRLFLEFEGVYRNAAFWVNGMYMDNHISGYTSHVFEITDALFEDEINSIAVRVDVDQVEGYWYEGAGIYRNVNLLVSESIYFKPYETVIKADICGKVDTSAVLVNDTGKEMVIPVRWTVFDFQKNPVAAYCGEAALPAFGEEKLSAQLQVDAPQLWDLDTPTLYTIAIEAIDRTEVTFGFREFAFDGEKGFFLNGRSVKIKGAAAHQDFGGVGIALSDNLIRYRLRKLKDMGANAFRTHYAHSPALLRACDEMGILVMGENRMFGTFPEAIKQFTDMVKRDRNHPSIFIWSIGNEETFVQHLPMGKHMAEKICRTIHALDDTRLCTYADNWSFFDDGITAGVPIKGINYIRNLDVDKYHREHPDHPILGTEEGCYVLDRNSIATDLSAQTLLSNGTVTCNWASTPKGWLKYVMERPWFMGAFLWLGFDSHGEPHPFVHSAFSTYMGAIDLCGIEKPVFYYYKAWWTEEPVLKITPHWNARPGQRVTVTVFTNCQHICLKRNGCTVGECDVAPYDAPEFTLDFVPGVLEVEGIRDGKTYYDSVTTAQAPCEIIQRLVLPCEKDADIGIIELCAVDQNGTVCASSNQKVDVALLGGDIVGVANGDPMDFAYEQKPEEYEYFYIRAFETEYGHYPIPPKQGNSYMYSPYRAEHKVVLTHEKTPDRFEDDYREVAGKIPARRVHAPRTFTFTNRCDLRTDFAYLEFERLHGSATVYLDGEKIGTNITSTSKDNRPFRFYKEISAGYHEIKVVSTLEDGTAGGMSGYVRFGKVVNKNNWSVDLYGGKARVFVKYKDSYALHTKFHEA